MIALSDIGYFARYTFDNRESTSGVDLQIASDLVNWDYLKETFERVTGQKAEIIHQTLDEWFQIWDNVERPVAHEGNVGENITWRRNFEGWWALWQDEVVKRDMDWVRQLNPKARTLENWMREQHYGEELFQRLNILKINEDGKATTPDWERIDRL